MNLLSEATSAATAHRDHTATARIRRLSLALLPFLSFLACGAAQAATVQDQDYEATNADSSFSNAAPGYRAVQTFTVGISGTLSEIDVFSFFQPTPADLTLNIYATDATGAPTSQALEAGVPQGAVTALPIDGFTGYSLSFATDLAVTDGEVLAFEPILRTGGRIIDWNGIYSGFANYPTPYAGGGLYDTGSATDKLALDTTVGEDFRTFVTIGGVPEPATWSLAIIGFGLTGLSLRRRRGRAALA
jgi:hypothetical protein